MVTRVGFLLPLFGLSYSCTTYSSELVSGSSAEAAIGAAGSGVSADAGSSSAGGVESGRAGGNGQSSGGQSGAHGGATNASSGSGGASANMNGAGGEGGNEPAAPPTGAGSITYWRWTNVPGGAIGDIPFAEPPDDIMTLDSFRAPIAGADYAALLKGFITPPLDGEYRFWIACDHNCELWLSTDETLDNEVIIASVVGVDRYTDIDEWGKYAAQQSGLIVLQAGKRYHVEATLKQGSGGEGLSVGWLKPGETGTQPSEVIPGKQLSPVDDSSP